MSNASVKQGFFASVFGAPMLVKAGAVGGVLSGASLGAMVSPGIGLAVGATLGGMIGIAAGVVMEREEKRASHRTRELDAIIGVTTGQIGAGGHIAPPLAEVRRQAELRSWVTEWMTPAPPQVG